MRTVHRAGTITTACLCTVIALAPLPFVSTYLKAIAVWVLSAIAALAISSALISRPDHNSHALLSMVCGYLIGRNRSLSLTPDIRGIRVGLCLLLNSRPYSLARSPAMAGEIQLSKFIPGAAPVSELLGGPFQVPWRQCFRWSVWDLLGRDPVGSTAKQDAP